MHPQRKIAFSESSALCFAALILGAVAERKKIMNKNTKKLVGVALLTAIVVVLQLFGSSIKFGTFSISLVLIPIVVGTALYGIGAGAWLGLVFGVTVLVSGDAALFLNLSVAGTIITVLLKGVGAGALSGVVYKALEKVNKYAATVAAAIVCPLVNTGIFLIGCRVFFYDAITSMAAENGIDNPITFMFVGLVGLNFVFELVVNIVLSPVIIRIINIGKKEAK